MYYGWKVAGATIATQAAQAGLLVYGFSALALPFEHEFGVPRAEVMIGSTCLSLASSALAPIAGRWIDLRSIRRLMLVGALMLGLGFLALSAAQTIWQVWLAYALLLPFGNVLLGQLTSAALITRWFSERRGRAMGLSTLGTSLGGFIFPLLITLSAQSLGWRGAAALIGVTTAVLIALLVAVLVYDRPADKSLAVDGQTSRAPVLAAGAHPSGLSGAQLLLRPAFWIITFGVGIKIATYFGLINNLGGFAAGLGLKPIFAASLVSILSVTSMVGKLGFGTLAERFAPKWLFVAGLSLTAASFALLFAATGAATVIAACLMLGLSTGGMFPLWSLMTARQFGDASFGRAMGLMNLMMVPLTAAAPPLAGWVYDRTGSYDGVILGSIAALTLAILLLLLLKSEPEQEATA